MKKNTNNSLYSTVQSTILRGVDMMDFFCENVLTSIEHERWLDRIFMVTRWVSERPNQVGRSLMALGHLAPRFYALPGPSDQFFYHIFFSSFSFVTKASSWFYQFHRKKNHRVSVCNHADPQSKIIFTIAFNFSKCDFFKKSSGYLCRGLE